MLKDHFILYGTVIIIFGLILGMFVRGMEEESILENKKLVTFEKPTLQSFIDTSYQRKFEEALSDQILFGTWFKSGFQWHKDTNISVVHHLIDSVWAETPVQVSTTEVAEQETEPSVPEPTKPEPIEIIKSPDSELIIQKNAPLQKEGVDKINLVTYNDGSFVLDMVPRGSGLMQVVGSNHLISAFRPLSRTQVMFDARAEQINTFAELHSDKQFAAFYIETDLDIDFINGRIGHENSSYLKSLLSNSVIYDTMEIKSPEQFLEYYFKTDHHWDTSGQIAAYEKLIPAILGPNEPVRSLNTYLTNLPFVGYKGRLLNDITTTDAFKFIHTDLPDYQVIINDEPGTYNNKQKYLEANVEVIDAFNYYGHCNGGDFGKVTFDFNQSDKPNMLVFVESFSNPLKEIVASHFNRTTYIDVRYYKETYGDFSMDTFLKQNDIDIILFFGYNTFYDALMPEIKP